MIGIASMNEKSTASLFLMPRNIAIVIVIPLRETPGTRAIAWATPIAIAMGIVISLLSTAMRSRQDHHDRHKGEHKCRDNGRPQIMLYKVLAEKPCNNRRKRRDNDLEQHRLAASAVAKIHKAFYDRAEKFPAIQEENREEAPEMKHNIIGKRIDVGFGDPEEPRDNDKVRRTAYGKKFGYTLNGTHYDALQDRHEMPPGRNRKPISSESVLSDDGIGGNGSTARRTRMTDSS